MRNGNRSMKTVVQSINMRIVFLPLTLCFSDMVSYMFVMIRKVSFLNDCVHYPIVLSPTNEWPNCLQTEEINALKAAKLLSKPGDNQCSVYICPQNISILMGEQNINNFFNAMSRLYHVNNQLTQNGLLMAKYIFDSSKYYPPSIFLFLNGQKW